MPIDASHVGRSYPPTAPHTVTSDEVAAFARALGAEPGPQAPPTFAMKLAAPAWQSLFDDAELGLALERTVHADQTFDIVRPLVPGDVATSSLRIERVRSRGAQDFVTVFVDVVVDGATACTSTSTFLCTREAS